MAEFINTIDVLGDDAVIDSIIDRTITEFKDDKVINLGHSAFRECTALETVDLPNLSSMEFYAFHSCTALINVNLPLVNKAHQYSFQNCTSLQSIVLPSALDINNGAFNGCASLLIVDAPVVHNIRASALANCASLLVLILRDEAAICILSGVNDLNNTPIKSGTGYIYVPRALVDSYKTATNWSTYAAQFRALEDYTVDGTVNGKFNGGVVTTDLYGVSLNNEDTFVMGSYQATLTPFTGHDITEVSVTMDGEDITNSVYSNGVIDIPLVAGDITIAARTDIRPVMVLLPLDTTKRLPRYRLNVRAGQTLRLHYYLTGPNGYLYDGRGCGSGYVKGGLETNTYKYRDITIAQDGFIVISDFWASNNEDGKLPPASSDVLVGNYLYVEILE